MEDKLHVSAVETTKMKARMSICKDFTENKQLNNFKYLLILL